MRELMNDEINFVAGGQQATASQVEGCGPVRQYDVIDCPQSDMGRFANDISNGVGQLVDNAIEVVKDLWGRMAN